MFIVYVASNSETGGGRHLSPGRSIACHTPPSIWYALPLPVSPPPLPLILVCERFGTFCLRRKPSRKEGRGRMTGGGAAAGGRDLLWQMKNGKEGGGSRIILSSLCHRIRLLGLLPPVTTAHALYRQ